MSHPSSSRYSYTEVLERAAIIFKKYLKEIGILSTIFYSLISSFVLIFGDYSFPLSIVILYIFITYLFIIFQSYENKKPVDLDQLFFRKKYFYTLLKIIKPLILLIVLLTLLSFLLLIPALIFGILWSFWEIVALDKTLSPKDTLEYSKKLVTGNWWYIFIYFIITIFISNLPSSVIESISPTNSILILLSNLTKGFITSFFIIGFFVIYRNLQKISH